MRFISLYTPLTDIVIVHIFYMNETTPRLAGWLHARGLFAGAGGAMLLTMG